MVLIRESDTRRATEYLIHANIGELSPVLIYNHINAGFTLLDVHQMLLEITPRSCGSTLRRILGKPPSANLRAGRLPVRLNSQQSAVAYMYAKIFELSLNVFGTRELAEQWMILPCRFLGGDAPLDVIHNPYAYRLIETYLQRVKLGIYQ